jgi:hypothetical protein
MKRGYPESSPENRRHSRFRGFLLDRDRFRVLLNAAPVAIGSEGR